MAPAALRQLIPGLLVLTGCHEVLAVPPPPLGGAETALVVAEGPGGGLTLFAGGAGLEGAPNLVLGEASRIWAFGFGCSLERLDLAGRNLRVEREGSVPPLPRPLAALRWTPGEGWSPTEAAAAPDPVPAFFAPDGSEPCPTFAPPVVASDPRATPLPLERPKRGAPFLTAVPDGEGGVVALQGVLEDSEPPGEVSFLGARLLALRALDRPVEILPDIPGLSAAVALASRGEGRLVVAGPTGAVEGDFTSGFAPTPAFPELSGAEAVELAVSRQEEPFEAFVLARSEHPVELGLTSTLTLHRVTAAGIESIRSIPARPLEDAAGQARPDAVIRVGPAEAFALGFSASSEILHVVNGIGALETISRNRDEAPLALAHHPEVGVVVIDADGYVFRRPPNPPPGPPWEELGRRSGDAGPLDLAVVDGFPAFPVYNPDVTDLGTDGGLRFTFLRPGGAACGTRGSNIRPSTSFTYATGELVAARASERAWWLLTAGDGDVRVSRIGLEGRAGVCGG